MSLVLHLYLPAPTLSGQPVSRTVHSRCVHKASTLVALCALSAFERAPPRGCWWWFAPRRADLVALEMQQLDLSDAGLPVRSGLTNCPSLTMGCPDAARPETLPP